MLNTFVLSGIVGYQVVWGVLPALHSPLMALTNAVSGIIIIGGMTIMNGDYLPADFPGLLAALSVSIASFNIFGGLYLTNKLLGIFGCCRHYDRPKINYLLRIAPLTAALGYYIGIKLGVPFPQLTNMAYIASTVSCIMALRGLSKLSTARMGNALGCLGVSLGVLATLG
jgi:NAD(P) transhydrogenase